MNENITPLPWRVTGSDGSQIRGGNTFIASVWLPRKPNEERMEGESWLAMRERTQPDRDAIDRELRANAAYIVEASNAYPALTARVKELEWREQEALDALANVLQDLKFRADLSGEDALDLSQSELDRANEILNQRYSPLAHARLKAALNKEPTT